MKELHHNIRTAQRRLTHLQEKLSERIEIEGEQVDECVCTDLKQIMEDSDQHINTQYPKDSFMYLFWTQQKEALAKKNMGGMRWHPLMIRWCLYLRHQSNKAYEVLRDAGLSLPSQRTLRDYTYCTKTTTGFMSRKNWIKGNTTTVTHSVSTMDTIILYYLTNNCRFWQRLWMELQTTGG